MSIQMKIGEDHEVMSQDPFCSGYVDSFGKWNNGFACPQLQDEPVFCCGTSTYRYCCTARDEAEPTSDFSTARMLLVIGVVLGTMITVMLVITAVCVFWKSCRTFKKRRSGGGPMYRMHSSSTTSAVANMYSYSPGSLGGGDVRHYEVEDVLQEVDEVAVTRPTRINNVSTIPRTFTSDHCNRVSFAESVGNSSVSTTTDNERQLFIEQSANLPPPYKLDGEVMSQPNEPRVMPFPRSFSGAAGAADLGAAHYQVPRSPADDALYRSTKF